MIKKEIIFIINDSSGHGGHVKSFIAQVKMIEHLFENIKIICSNLGYIQKNLHEFNKIKKENLIFSDLRRIRRYYFNFELINNIKSNITEKSILHVYSPECYFSALFAKSFYQDILLINSVMGGPNPFPYLLSTDLYIAVSEEQKKDALGDLKVFEDNRVQIIKSRIVIKNDIINIDRKAEVILIVSRFDRDKLPSLNRIFDIVDLLHQRYSIVIAGTGELLNKYKIRYKKNKNIEFIGYCSDLMRYNKEALVVLGMGRSILEFLLHKTPAILIGFKGIELLDTLDTIKFASSYNFSGRNILQNVDNKIVLNKIVDYTNRKETVKESVYTFLDKEYNILYFQEKYLECISVANPQKIKRIQILIEYLHILKIRIIRTIKRKLDLYK